MLLTALVMKWRVGKGQTTLQWMDLMILTVMIIVFQMMPNDFNAAKPKGATVKDNAMLGMVMTMAKVLWPVNSNARTGEKAKEISKSQIPNFPNFLGLVLGCIEAKFCK